MQRNRIHGCAIVALLASIVVVFGCGEDDPSSPGGGSGGTATVIGNIDIAGTASGVAVRPNGSHAFVAAGGDGFKSVSLADKTAPTLTQTLAEPARGGVLFASNNVAYVAAGLTGFHVVNTTNPAGMSATTTVNTAGMAQNFALTDQATPVLCVADGASGVQFYFGSSGSSTYDTPQQATDVAVSDEYCYVADLDFGGVSSSLQIIDITNAGSPSLAGSLPLGGSPAGIVYKDGYVYVAAGDPGMYVIDVSDPTTPSIAGQTGALPATGAIDIDPARALVYLGTTDTAGFPNDGLKIIDVSNPASPKVVRTVDLPNWTVGVAYQNDHVYASTADIGGSDPSTLQIIQLSGF